jgi:hypothetical protein
MRGEKFRALFFTSLGVAILTLVTPVLLKPGIRDFAIELSALFALAWAAIVLYAFIKFKKRGFWFLLGTPLIFFWFFILFLIAWGCAHGVRACP